MTTTARAAVLLEPNKLEIQEFPLPKTGPDDALMRVEACGVCASDAPIYRGEMNYQFPVVLGHEIVGRVEHLGERAAARWGVSEGDRIIIERWIPCGRCERCFSGEYRLCRQYVGDQALFYGGTPTTVEPMLWGGFADYLYLHPDSVVYKVSDAVPAVQLPLFTPLSNSISWLTLSGGLTMGDTVVIQGPGQEGLMAALTAAKAGASTVIVVGLTADEYRLRAAERLGATHTIVADEEDVVERVKEITAGRMADVVLDVTSARTLAPVETAIKLAGTGGTVVVAGAHLEPAMELPVWDFLSKQVTVKGVFGRDRSCVLTAIRMIEAGSLPLDTLTTHHFSLDETDLALKIVSRLVDEPALHVSVVPS